MTANDALSTFRQIIGWIGLVLAVLAMAKYFGFNAPIRGSTADTALVAIACLLSR